MTRADELPVSVLVPAYNRAGLVRRALEGVRAQSPWRPAEVIVIDDGSDDEDWTAADPQGIGSSSDLQVKTGPTG